MIEERLVEIETMFRYHGEAPMQELCAEIRRCWAEIAQLDIERTALIKGLAPVVAHEIDQETDLNG